MFASRYNHTERAKACKAEKCKNRPIFAVFCFAPRPQSRPWAKSRDVRLCERATNTTSCAVPGQMRIAGLPHRTEKAGAPKSVIHTGVLTRAGERAEAAIK